MSIEDMRISDFMSLKLRKLVIAMDLELFSMSDVGFLLERGRDLGEESSGSSGRSPSTTEVFEGKGMEAQWKQWKTPYKHWGLPLLPVCFNHP